MSPAFKSGGQGITKKAKNTYGKTFILALLSNELVKIAEQFIWPLLTVQTPAIGPIAMPSKLAIYRLVQSS